jgi:hypothetical protein
MTGQFANEYIVNTTSTNNDASSPRWYMELMDLSSRRSRRIYYRDARNFGTLKFVLSARDLQDKLDWVQIYLMMILRKMSFYELWNSQFRIEIFVSSSWIRARLLVLGELIMDCDAVRFIVFYCFRLLTKFSTQSNYILTEGLYRARIDPFADLHEIDMDQRRLLFHHLQEVTSTSYASQGLTRPRGGTYRSFDGDQGEFEFQLQCYGQLISPNGNKVVREVNCLHGRTILVSSKHW